MSGRGKRFFSRLRNLTEQDRNLTGVPCFRNRQKILHTDTVGKCISGLLLYLALVFLQFEYLFLIWDSSASYALPCWMEDLLIWVMMNVVQYSNAGAEMWLLQDLLIDSRTSCACAKALKGRHATIIQVYTTWRSDSAASLGMWQELDHTSHAETKTCTTITSGLNRSKKPSSHPTGQKNGQWCFFIWVFLYDQLLI